jgi:carnosine N-methyltransferase
MAESPEEKAHWHSVLKAFDGYMQYHVRLTLPFPSHLANSQTDTCRQLSANHARRMAFLALPKDHKAVYEVIGYREKLDAVDEGIRRYVLLLHRDSRAEHSAIGMLNLSMQ